LLYVNFAGYQQCLLLKTELQTSHSGNLSIEFFLIDNGIRHANSVTNKVFKPPSNLNIRLVEDLLTYLDVNLTNKTLSLELISSLSAELEVIVRPKCNIKTPHIQ